MERLAKVEESFDIDITSKLLREPNLNSIDLIINKCGYGSIEKLSDAILMISILTGEIQELKKRETENRLLIEHEETVRTTKAKPIVGGQNLKSKFKIGDIVEYNPVGSKVWVKSKIISTGRNRFNIELMETKSQAGVTGARRFVGAKQIRFYIKAA